MLRKKSPKGSKGMSWTTDRSIRDNRLLLFIIIGIVVIAAAVGFIFQSSMNTQSAPQIQPKQVQTPLLQPGFRNEPLTLMLFYPLDGVLVVASAPVKRQPDAQEQARETMTALFLDQRAVQAAVLRDIKLRAFYLDTQGTAYVDLTSAQHDVVRASAWEEELAIYAIVNTLTQNFEEIKQVKFLMDGKDAQTLAGHLDLERLYTRRMDLVKQ